MRVKYDKHSNIVSITSSGTMGNVDAFKSKSTYKNTYDNVGNLVKRISSAGTKDASTSKYTYKAVKVSKSAASKIEHQQWSLLNSDLSFAFGTTV